MRPSHTLAYIVVCLFYFATLAQAAEVRKLGSNDLEWATPNQGAATTTVSPGGKTVTKIDAAQVPFRSVNGYVDNLFDGTYSLTPKVADLITGGPWVDVRKHGTALTDVPIQAALSAIDNSIGAEVFIPRGQYEIGTGLLLQNKNNVTIRGAGKDVTILHMNYGTATQPSVYNGGGTWGILTIESNAALDTNVTDILIKDLTFWLDNTPGTLVPGSNLLMNVYFLGATNITFENVKIRGGEWAGLYTDGNSSSPPTRIRVLNSDFIDTHHNALNTNTGDARDVLITGCFFDNTRFGVQVVGQRINISNNIFKDVGAAIIAAEASYPGAKTDASDITISNNIITGLGANNTATTDIYGISVNGGDSQFTDNTIDHAIIVANNSISSSIKRSTNGGSLTAFQLAGGNMKVSNNHVSGLTREAGATGDAVAYFLGKGAASGVARQQIHFNNNSLDNTLFGDLWNRGISVAGGDNTYIYMVGNTITGNDPTNYSLYVPTGTGSPYISLNGDILDGYVHYPGKWGTINNPATFNSQPIFGNSINGLRSAASEDLIYSTFTDNNATPSVAAGRKFQTANTGATTITNFTGATKGQQFSILFTDNVTTVQNNANVKLQGAANFVATPDDILVLEYDGSTKREVGRSVN